MTSGTMKRALFLPGIRAMLGTDAVRTHLRGARGLLRTAANAKVRPTDPVLSLIAPLVACTVFRWLHDKVFFHDTFGLARHCAR